jgi:hypothetical protein
MRGSLPSARTVRRWAAELEQALERGADDARAWLATPQGRRLRTLAAQALVLTAPLILRHPFFKTPAGRLVEVAGGAALLVKLAELMRDWEPELGTPPAPTA